MNTNDNLKDITDKLTIDFVKAIQDQENDIVREDLKRKGFEFENDYELKEFIKEHGQGFQKENLGYRFHFGFK